MGEMPTPLAIPLRGIAANPVGFAKAVPGSASTVLEVRGFEVRLGEHGVAIVTDVSFDVAAGEVLGLVGESGSGKTTIALGLLGHSRRGLAIAAGEVRLNGVDLLSIPARQLRNLRGARVAYVPQDPSAALNPALRIGIQLREALSSHQIEARAIEARLADILGEARLEANVLRRYPHQLSGGQQQRVALAMAFSCRPSLIVLDEPTTGLDVTTQRHVLDSVRSLCCLYDVAAVYVSHDLAVVDGLATTVAVMYAGQLIELGPTAEVFSRPGHPYTRSLLDAVPSPERAHVLQGIPGQPPPPGRRPQGCSFSTRCPWVIERCRMEAPTTQSVGNQQVRCHRASELRGSMERKMLVPTVRPVTSKASLLSVEALDAFYGDSQVLFGVDLTVDTDRCLAVVGESGSGKTTLARCIAGLHSNWKGKLRFDGQELARSARQRPSVALRRIQYIFQNPYTSLNPRHTVEQIVSQQLRQFFEIKAHERAERTRAALESVSLNERYLDLFPDELSGGERQRVAIARALVVEPEMLICDEVTSALDVSVQAVIIEMLRSLQQERHLTMIFITHNLALVRSIGQDIIVLRDGRVVDRGPSEAVLDHSDEAYTRQLMADVPRVEL